MPDYVTDTHGLIWYLEDSPRLGAQASACFAACDRGECIIYVSTICLVEIIYLDEKRRVPADMKMQPHAALLLGFSGIALADLTVEVASRVSAVYREQVPDMPDRIIAATALHLDLALITRDHQIKVSGINTVW